MKVHVFRTTGQAYDACNCSDEVSIGDVIVIESEKVVGVSDAWPLAVTKERGSLHQLLPGFKIEGLKEDTIQSRDADKIIAGWYEARLIAKFLGYELDR